MPQMIQTSNNHSIYSIVVHSLAKYLVSKCSHKYASIFKISLCSLCPLVTYTLEFLNEKNTLNLKVETLFDGYSHNLHGLLTPMLSHFLTPMLPSSLSFEPCQLVSIKWFDHNHHYTRSKLG